MTFKTKKEASYRLIGRRRGRMGGVRSFEELPLRLLSSCRSPHRPKICLCLIVYCSVAPRSHMHKAKPEEKNHIFAADQVSSVIIKKNALFVSNAHVHVT